MSRGTKGFILVCLLALSGLSAADSVLAAYPVAQNGKLLFWRQELPEREIYSINPDGSGLTNLTRTGAPIDELYPAISPDGRLIAYTRDEHGANSSDLWVMAADGSGQRPLIPQTTDIDEVPAFSPDGRWIAFSRCNSGDCNIYLVGIDGSGLHPVTSFPPGGGAYGPTFSPDGRKIAFERYLAGAGNSDIWTVNAGGGGEQDLTRTAGPTEREFTPDYFPDGRRIAYVALTNSDIWTMNADGSAQVNLTNSPTREESYPAPSPDGSLIAYKGQIGAGNEILVIKADGTQPVAVTHDPIAVEEFDPTWEHIYTCGGRRATIVGSDSGERLRGTKRADVIVANGGRDKIKGKGGKDRICAGSGKDRLIGGEGKDRCVGGPGRDKGKACEKGKL